MKKTQKRARDIHRTARKQGLVSLPFRRWARVQYQGDHEVYGKLAVIVRGAR